MNLAASIRVIALAVANQIHCATVYLLCNT
jgi:hypothetical protein